MSDLSEIKLGIDKLEQEGFRYIRIMYEQNLKLTNIIKELNAKIKIYEHCRSNCPVGKKPIRKESDDTGE